MNEEGPSQPKVNAEPKANAGAFMGPDIMVAAPAQPMGTLGPAPTEADLERKGAAAPPARRSLLDRLLNRHPEPPEA